MRSGIVTRAKPATKVCPAEIKCRLKVVFMQVLLSTAHLFYHPWESGTLKTMKLFDVYIERKARVMLRKELRKISREMSKVVRLAQENSIDGKRYARKAQIIINNWKI